MRPSRQLVLGPLISRPRSPLPVPIPLPLLAHSPLPRLPLPRARHRFCPGRFPGQTRFLSTTGSVPSLMRLPAPPPSLHRRLPATPRRQSTTSVRPRPKPRSPCQYRFRPAEVEEAVEEAVGEDLSSPRLALAPSW